MEKFCIMLTLPILLFGSLVLVAHCENYVGPPRPCGSSEYCRRETCNDSRAVVPPKCRRLSKIIQCVDVCRDPLELKQCFEERKLNDTEEYCVMKYRREIDNYDAANTTHPGLPCELKCLVDPEFWTCVHKCDGKGCLESFHQCEEVWIETENGTIPPPCSSLTPNATKINSTCFYCYVNTLRKELKFSKECAVRYPQPQTQQTVIRPIQTSCVEIIDGAGGVIGGDNVTRNITEKCFLSPVKQPFEQCFLKLLMQRQVGWCMTSTGLYTAQCKFPGPASKECHDKCMKLLTKPYCYIPCPRNPHLQTCVDDCNIKWSPIDCNNTDICNSNILDARARLATYDGNIGLCPVKNHDCLSKHIDTVRKMDNCKSKRFVIYFGQRIIELRSAAGNFGPDIEKLAEHYFYSDCLSQDCKLRSREDGIRCVQTCMKKKRSAEEMNMACNEMNSEGRELRSIIMLWCMLEYNSSRYWTFESLLTFKNIDDFMLYDFLSKCEVEVRDKNKDRVGTTGFREFARIIYEIEQKSCEDCAKVENKQFDYHPYSLELARCELNQCYKRKLSDPNLCPPQKEEVEIRLVRNSQCQWKVDLSLSREPYKIWSTYFDEFSPIDETNNLRSPNGLKYLQKSALLSRIGHYVFPYFLIIRGHCDEGFYDEDVYKFIDNGGSPVAKISYSTQISRLVFVTFMSASFQSALINLQREDEDDKEYIPQNPLNRINKTTNSYDGKSGCHLNLCYPAFAIPQALLQIPFFEYAVGTQQTFYKHGGFQYASGLHVRDISGNGRLKVADYENPPRADEFFPRQKVLNYEDTQLTFMSFCLPDRKEATTKSGFNDCPELEHLTDHNCVPYKKNETVGGSPFAPLDSEDFMRLQYAYKLTTVIVLAGFYDPNLVIIGDADLEKFETVRWKFDATDGSEGSTTAPRLFHGRYPCFSANLKVHGFHKPMYSQFDRTDPAYAMQYYRTRYAMKNYTNAAESKAIFGALTLQDRILLVTTSGIVTLYINDNVTSSKGKSWAVDPRDRVAKCFKIVRTAQRAQPNSDTVVAITYDYQEYYPQTKEIKEISQEVYIGTHMAVGKPMDWRRIGENIDIGANLKEERVFNVDDELGVTETLPDTKIIGIPVERRETSPKSQIESICYKAYRSNMGKSKYIELFEDHGWCDALDAAPLAYPEREIQVLVRMKVYYSGGYGSSGGTGSITNAPRRIAFFYIIANLKTDTPLSQPPVWRISSIIPRIPCLDEHTEGVPNVVQFTEDYFRKGDPAVVGTNYGCHTIAANQNLHNQIFLHGITYTRTYNTHMFVYGNKLLQSNDGGITFVYLKSFPDKSSGYKCEKSALRYHRIKMMAFDDTGHYAFLTSKRELWYGNVGHLHQVRLRPSDSFSMTIGRLAQVREMAEAVPFTVFFDSDDSLVEMVAVVDQNGDVERISRRSINEKTIRRAKWYIKQLDIYAENLKTKLKANIDRVEKGGNSTISPELLEPLRYQPSKFTIFCPYSSPTFRHNFSEKYARAQTFFFPVPSQHADLGNTYLKTTLLTYQAIIFGLVWNTYLNEPHRTYSYVNLDPFVQWIKNRNEDSVIGALKYIHNRATSDGILVEPVKYSRVFNNAADSKRLFKIFYMDYGMVLSFTIEYSISNDFDLSSIDYENHKLSLIHLNVENGNGSLILVNTAKEVIASRAAVRYRMHISVKKQDDLPQRPSGRDGIPVPILLNLIGGFGTCIKTETTATGTDTVGTIINVGCPPSIDIVFDWNSTLHSIKFRDPTAHYGSTPKECYNGEQFCFFARYPLIPHFHLFDSSKQQHFNFSGKYTMRIVGGGYSRHELKTYTTEEREAFNVPGVSDVSLIWTEWDRSQHQKVDRKQYGTESNRKDNREIVLRAGVSAIQWACHTLSPCARIAPRSTLETVYYFEVLITNQGVDNDTLCLFEKKFIILLYGFPPSPEVQLLTTVFFYVLMIAVLYVLYFCLRGHKKLWRSTNMKLYGWFQIVKDTFPKAWTKSEDNEESELDEQKRRDEIILSLQGHLKVPAFVQRHTDIVHHEDHKSKQNSPSASHHSSFSSHYSLASTKSQPTLINPVAPRTGAMTWTDLIYEQIISRRLASIIEKNRVRAEDLRKKASENA